VSAYICAFAMFDMLAGYAARRRVHLYPPHELRDAVEMEFGTDTPNLATYYPRAARVLYAENVRSVAYRYRDDSAAPDYRFTPIDLMPTASRVLGAIACLRYQSCECPDYHSTVAAFVLDAIERDAIRQITEGQHGDVAECEVRRAPIRIPSR
jgi:hypothetical protein